MVRRLNYIRTEPRHLGGMGRPAYDQPGRPTLNYPNGRVNRSVVSRCLNYGNDHSINRLLFRFSLSGTLRAQTPPRAKCRRSPRGQRTNHRSDYPCYGQGPCGKVVRRREVVPTRRRASCPSSIRCGDLPEPESRRNGESTGAQATADARRGLPLFEGAIALRPQPSTGVGASLTSTQEGHHAE